MSVKMNTASSEEAKVYIREQRSSIEKRSHILNAFCSKENWMRADILRLKSVMEAYDAVIDLVAQIVTSQNDWMEFVQAENKNIDSTFRDEIFSAYLNKMGLLINKTKEKFKYLFEAYLSHKTVKEYLKVLCYRKEM